jgi:hypothetical protein
VRIGAPRVWGGPDRTAPWARAVQHAASHYFFLLFLSFFLSFLDFFATVGPPSAPRRPTAATSGTTAPDGRHLPGGARQLAVNRRNTNGSCRQTQGELCVGQATPAEQLRSESSLRAGWPAGQNLALSAEYEPSAGVRCDRCAASS